MTIPMKEGLLGYHKSLGSATIITRKGEKLPPEELTLPATLRRIITVFYRMPTRFSTSMQEQITHLLDTMPSRNAEEYTEEESQAFNEACSFMSSLLGAWLIGVTPSGRCSTIEDLVTTVYNEFELVCVHDTCILISIALELGHIGVITLPLKVPVSLN